MMKKIIILLLCTLTIGMLTACNFAASYQVVTINVETGDTFAATIATKSHVWEIGMDKNIFCVSENDDTKLQCMFMTEPAFINYVCNVDNYLSNGSQDMQFIDQGEINGLRYVIVSFADGQGTKTYEVIGWIIGSNTGIVGDCTESEDMMRELLESLTFKIKKTQQNNELYYCNAIESIEQ